MAIYLIPAFSQVLLLAPEFEAHLNKQNIMIKIDKVNIPKCERGGTSRCVALVQLFLQQ